MRVAVDTNVWVSGLIRPRGTPGEVLQALRDRRLTPVVSWEHAEEIAAVLSRPWLARYGVTHNDVRDVLELLAPVLPEVEIEVPLRDPTDVPVVVGALAGRAEAIVTGDADFLEDDALGAWLDARGVAVLTPRELLARLRAR